MKRQYSVCFRFIWICKDVTFFSWFFLCFDILFFSHLFLNALRISIRGCVRPYFRPLDTSWISEDMKLFRDKYTGRSPDRQIWCMNSIRLVLFFCLSLCLCFSLFFFLLLGIDDERLRSKFIVGIRVWRVNSAAESDRQNSANSEVFF